MTGVRWRVRRTSRIPGRKPLWWVYQVGTERGYPCGSHRQAMGVLEKLMHGRGAYYMDRPLPPSLLDVA